MAIISNVSLTPTQVGNFIRLAVSYTLTPSQVEKLAGSVFTEAIGILAEDGVTDPQLAVVAPLSFAVSTATPTVSRTRNVLVPKAVLNEDPNTEQNGSEIRDEILAKVGLVYAANAPNPVPPIVPAFSGVVTGFWT